MAIGRTRGVGRIIDSLIRPWEKSGRVRIQRRASARSIGRSAGKIGSSTWRWRCPSTRAWMERIGFDRHADERNRARQSTRCPNSSLILPFGLSRVTFTSSLSQPRRLTLTLLSLSLSLWRGFSQGLITARTVSHKTLFNLDQRERVYITAAGVHIRADTPAVFFLFFLHAPRSSASESSLKRRRRGEQRHAAFSNSSCVLDDGPGLLCRGRGNKFHPFCSFRGRPRRVWRCFRPRLARP